MVIGEDYSSSYIYHIIRVLDNSSTFLDETMFEGILDFCFSPKYSQQCRRIKCYDSA